MAFYRDAQVNPGDIMAVIGLDGIARARRAGSSESSGEDMRGHRGHAPADAGSERHLSRPERARWQACAISAIAASAITGCSSPMACSNPRCSRPRAHRARIFIAGTILVSRCIIVAFAAFLTLHLSRRDQREVELARANERLQEAQRIGQIGDWDYDLRTGEAILVAAAARHVRTDAGARHADLRGVQGLSGRGGAGRDRPRPSARRSGPARAQEIEYEVRLPSGAESQHQSAVIPTFDAAGNVVRLHGTDQNVSARMLLDRLQTQVAHLSRVEAMNAMAATLAHELNQPLTAASNYLAGSRRLLQSRARRGGRARYDRGGASGASRRRHHPAVFARWSPISPRRVTSLLGTGDRRRAALLAHRRACSLELKLSAGAGRRTRAAMNGGPDPNPAGAGQPDPQRAAMPSTAHAEPEIAHLQPARDEAGSVIVIPSPTTAPASASRATSASRPLHRRKGRGSGLGLSISRTIIESHGGRIWTEDRETGGARVSFTLPAPRRQADRDSLTAAA